MQWHSFECSCFTTCRPLGPILNCVVYFNSSLTIEALQFLSNGYCRILTLSPKDVLYLENSAWTLRVVKSIRWLTLAHSVNNVINTASFKKTWSITKGTTQKTILGLSSLWFSCVDFFLVMKILYIMLLHAHGCILGWPISMWLMTSKRHDENLQQLVISKAW